MVSLANHRGVGNQHHATRRRSWVAPNPPSNYSPTWTRFIQAMVGMTGIPSAASQMAPRHPSRYLQPGPPQRLEAIENRRKELGLLRDNAAVLHTVPRELMRKQYGVPRQPVENLRDVLGRTERSTSIQIHMTGLLSKLGSVSEKKPLFKLTTWGFPNSAM